MHNHLCTLCGKYYRTPKALFNYTKEQLKKNKTAKAVLSCICGEKKVCEVHKLGDGTWEHKFHKPSIEDVNLKVFQSIQLFKTDQDDYEYLYFDSEKHTYLKTLPHISAYHHWWKIERIDYEWKDVIKDGKSAKERFDTVTVYSRYSHYEKAKEAFDKLDKHYNLDTFYHIIPDFPDVDYTMRVRTGDIVGIYVRTTDTYMIAEVKQVIYTVDNGSLVRCKALHRGSEIGINKELRKQEEFETFNSAYIFHVFKHSKIGCAPIKQTSHRKQIPYQTTFTTLYSYINSLPFSIPLTYLKTDIFNAFTEQYPQPVDGSVNRKLFKRWLRRNIFKLHKTAKETREIIRVDEEEREAMYFADLEREYEDDFNRDFEEDFLSTGM